MTIGNSFIFILFALIPIIILLHILLRRMEIKKVSSLFIWEKVKKKTIYTFPTILLLLLQILIIVGFIFSLADIKVPFVLKRRKESTVLIIDNSASMNVIENGKSRLNDAKEKAINVIKGSSGEIMVITASFPPEIISSYNRDRDDLIKSIRSIKTTEFRNGIEESMKIASASVTPSGSIIMISDGAFDYVPSETDSFKFIRAGREKTFNIGITDFYLRRKTNNDTYELYLTISNFSQENISYGMEIKIGDEILEKRSSVSSSGEVKRIIIDIESNSEKQISAEIFIDDLLKSDNKASAYISSNSRKSVLLITPGNFFLENALKSIPEIEIEVYTADLVDENRIQPVEIPDLLIPDNFDVVIFDRIPPSRHESLAHRYC